MSAHVSQGGAINVSGSTGSSTIYTSPANGVHVLIVQPIGEMTWIGWYDSTGNTLHGSGVLVGPNSQLTFSSLSTNDILVAVAAEGNSTLFIGEIY